MTTKTIYHNTRDTKVTEKIITKNGKYLEKLTQINKTQINKIRDEKGTTATDTKHIQKITETVLN